MGKPARVRISSATFFSHLVCSSYSIFREEARRLDITCLTGNASVNEYPHVCEDSHAGFHFINTRVPRSDGGRTTEPDGDPARFTRSDPDSVLANKICVENV